MLRVTRLTDYGIALMGQLVRASARQSSGTSVNASTRDLAEMTGLPVSTATKILKALCRGGLLESQRGNGGGYTLARPAATISVADIVTAIEGPIAITQGGVPSAEQCPIGANWEMMNQAVTQALGGVTLDALMHGGELPAGQPLIEKKGRM